MKFKKHIVLSVNYQGKYGPYDKIKIQVKNGINSSELKDNLDNDWVPDKKDRIYFFPGCTVPRFKVREKFNTTIKPEYASVAFISSRGLKGSENMFEVISRAVMLPGEYMMDWLESIYGEDHAFVLKYKSILLNCEDQVIIDDDSWYKIKNGCPSDATYQPRSIQSWRRDVLGEEWNDTYIPASEEVGFYSPVRNSAFDKLTCKIYSQDAILDILNEGNIVINKKKYAELRLMANSEDDENIILVMELMANANYQESFVYLLLLLKEFNSKIIARSKEISHVNFKSLLLFLDLDERTLKNITIEKLMTGMKKHKQFTRSNLQQITQFFAAGADPTKPNDDGVTDTVHFTTGPVLRPEYYEELDDFDIEDEPKPETEENFNL